MDITGLAVRTALQSEGNIVSWQDQGLLRRVSGIYILMWTGRFRCMDKAQKIQKT